MRQTIAGLVCALTVGLGAASVAVGQVTVVGDEPRPTPRFQPEMFFTLPGDAMAVRYRSSGGLDRAAHVLRRLEVLGSHFDKWSELPVPLIVYVMTREEWQDAELPGAYGIPLRIGPVSIALASRGDAEAVEYWRRALGTETLPMIPGSPLTGTRDEVATLAISDVLLQVEAGRSLVQRAGFLGREPWVGEVIAHAVALIVFAQQEEDRLPEITDLFDRLAGRFGGDARLSLGDFSPRLLLEGPEGVDDWLGYQGLFNRGSRVLVAEHGKDLVKRLKKMSKKSGGALEIEELLQRYELSPWIDSHFSSGSGR